MGGKTKNPSETSQEPSEHIPTPHKSPSQALAEQILSYPGGSCKIKGKENDAGHWFIIGLMPLKTLPVCRNILHGIPGSQKHFDKS
jgi:hypothetical protein